MSLLDRFRPRWRHSDPVTRKSALADLADPAVLRRIFEGDPDPEVRRAAFERITEQEYLAHIAKGETELNLRAAERLVDQQQLVDVAQRAVSPRVRAAVVPRIEDGEALQRIASLDLDPEVRALAKQRRAGPDGFRDYLQRALAQLEVAQHKAERTAEFCGTLDDVCGALVTSGRYRINAVVTAPGEAPPGAGAKPDFTCVELLANRADGPASATDERGPRVFYRIKIWRQGDNFYSGAVEERRLEIASNAVAWGDSSKGD